MAKKNGPTLNPRYNILLIQWGQEKSECEECGKDCEGEMIHDCGTGWFCSGCKEKVEDRNLFFDQDDKEIRRQEQGYYEG